MYRGRSSHVRNVVGDLIDKLETVGLKRTSAVEQAWSRSAGDDAKSHSRPVNFKKGVLTVIVENAPWMYRMTLDKNQTIKKFNQAYSGRAKLKDIRFRIGNIDR
jgi:predicted nucleic acid-binding Zn ribbon protein